MLVPEPQAKQTPMIQAMMFGSLANEHKEGMYQISHFGGTNFLAGYEHYPDFEEEEFNGLACYGVCDEMDQLIEKFPALETSERKFVITFKQVVRDAEPKMGGWRWHKWGPYIGDQNPQCEYLADEPEIRHIFVYHIYELE